MKRIDILGTPYSLSYDDLDNKGGKADLMNKTIKLDNEFKTTHPDWKLYYLRHEIIHAFLFESGCRHFCEDEHLVDLLAVQFPKIMEVIQNAERFL
jgi:hypothetical protein